MSKATKEEKARAVERLRAILKPGDTVYCILRHRSASGMSRVIEFIAIKDNRPRRLSGYISTALDMPYHRDHDGVKVRGCGMDMDFHVVYNLDRALFPDGYGVMGEMPTGHEIRPETEALAKRAFDKGALFYGRNGDPSGWDSDGGYALKSEWL